jgi:hypothetical protein
VTMKKSAPSSLVLAPGSQVPTTVTGMGVPSTAYVAVVVKRDGAEVALENGTVVKSVVGVLEIVVTNSETTLTAEFPSVTVKKAGSGPNSLLDDDDSSSVKTLVVVPEVSSEMANKTVDADVVVTVSVVPDTSVTIVKTTSDTTAE